MVGDCNDALARSHAVPAPHHQGSGPGQCIGERMMDILARNTDQRTRVLDLTERDSAILQNIAAVFASRAQPQAAQAQLPQKLKQELDHVEDSDRGRHQDHTNNNNKKQQALHKSKSDHGYDDSRDREHHRHRHHRGREVREDREDRDHGRDRNHDGREGSSGYSRERSRKGRRGGHGKDSHRDK